MWQAIVEDDDTDFKRIAGNRNDRQEGRIEARSDRLRLASQQTE